MKHIMRLDGDRDSVAMILSRFDRGDPIDELVFCDPGILHDEMYAAVKRVGEIVELPVTVVKSPFRMQRLIQERGWPKQREKSPKWCAKILKIDPFEQYLFDRYKNESISVHEAPKGASYCSPIKGLKAERNMWYCEKHGIRYGLIYSKISGRCWCCPLQNERSLYNLYTKKRSQWRILVQMDKLAPHNYKDHRPLSEFERKFANMRGNNYVSD